jgi:hypothetical protein
MGTQSVAQKAIAKARNEIAEEESNKAVKGLKELYRKRGLAKTVLANVEREIEDFEQAITDGNG